MNRVRFIVTYCDGTTAVMSLDSVNLRKGDHAALAEVQYRQTAGLLPKGEIRSIRRPHDGAPAAF